MPRGPKGERRAADVIGCPPICRQCGARCFAARSEQDVGRDRWLRDGWQPCPASHPARLRPEGITAHLSGSFNFLT